MPITEEQLEVMQDLFHKLDKEGSFSINAGELETAVKSEIQDESFRNVALNAIGIMDRTDEGAISFVEFVSTLKRDMRSQEKEKPEEKHEEKPEEEKSEETPTTEAPASETAAPAEAAKSEDSKPEPEKKEDEEEPAPAAEDPKQPKVEEGPILKEGPLLKEGEIFKTWKKRHFVLRNGLMSYHEKKGGKLIKSFAFDKAVVGISSAEFRKKKGNRKNLFEIITKNRTWYLAAESEDEMKSWVDTLVNQCGCTNRQAVQVTDGNEAHEGETSPKRTEKEKEPEAPAASPEPEEQKKPETETPPAQTEAPAPEGTSETTED